MRDARVMASWALALFLIVMLLWIADQSLFPPSASKNVIFPLLAEKSGIVFFEPTGRYVAGLGHVLAAFLLLIPWTRRIGAILAVVIAAAGIAAQMMWIGMAVPTEVGAKTTDGGQVFYLSLALAVAALVLAMVHPGGEENNAKAGGKAKAGKKDKAKAGGHGYYGQ